MSVVYVLSRIRPGGSLTLVNERLRRLDRSRVVPSVCALLPTGESAAVDEVLAEWHSTDVRLTVIGHAQRRDLPKSLSALVRVARSVDIVHNVNGPQSHVTAACCLARRPLIRDLISTAPPSPIDRSCARVAKLNLAVSNAVDMVHGAPRTRVLYPPIALTAAASAQADVETGTPTVLVVARFMPGKGLHLLPAIVEQLAKLLPSVQVLVAGDGPDRHMFEAELVTRGVADHVRLLGFRPDVFALHHVADVFLSTSEAEGLVGYATLEAAVAGTPIVASPIPAVTEVFRDGVDALLVDPNSPADVAEAVALIARDDALAESLRRSARERVAAVLDPMQAVRALELVYESVARRERRRWRGKED